MPKIVVISDTHQQHHKLTLPKADWIIHAGDISSMGRENEVKDFLDWFGSLNYDKKIFIAGNHDFLYERQPELAKSMIPENVIYLETSGVEIDGIKIWGEPRQPRFFDWAFNVDRGDAIKKYWDMIPEDINILICHGPPHGILDMTLEGDLTGCEELLKRMSQLPKLRLVIVGHIHEARGYYKFADGQTIINASVLNRSYQLVNKPYLIEIDDNKTVKLLDF